MVGARSTFCAARQSGMAKGAGRASGVTQHVGASVAKRDAHLERERVQRERFRELYNQFLVSIVKVWAQHSARRRAPSTLTCC